MQDHVPVEALEERHAAANHDGHEEPVKKGRKRKTSDDGAPRKPRRPRAKKAATKSDE